MRRLAIVIAVASLAMSISASVQAAGIIHVYGPGGPLPAMKEAAAAFGK